MSALTARDLTRIADHYVDNCLRLETPPQVKELALKLNLDRSNFSKLFTRIVGEHATSYMQHRQMEYAKHLLVNSDYR